MPFGMAGDDLAFEFELHHRGRFLHACHHDLIPQTGPFDLKTGRGIVGVDGAGQKIKRLNRNPVAFFQLEKPSITNGDAQHMTDQGFVAKTSA